MTSPIPSPEEQVHFLRNIQRLLAEGLFVASYKLALVHALADLAVLKGEDSGTPLKNQHEGYRRKVRGIVLEAISALSASRWDLLFGLILQQNTGRQASIISKIVDAQQTCGASLFRLKQSAPVAGQNWLLKSIKLSARCHFGNYKPLETSGWIFSMTIWTVAIESR